MPNVFFEHPYNGCILSGKKVLESEHDVKAWNTRKPMERIVERLEEKSEEHDEARRIAHGKGLYNVEEIQESKASCFMEAIEIIKEEGGIE